MITLPVGWPRRRGAVGHRYATCMEELADVFLGVPHDEDVVHGHRADQVEEEPGLDVLPGDQLGVQDDFVREVIEDYTWRGFQHYE